MKDSNHVSRADFFKTAGVLAGTTAFAGKSSGAAEEEKASGPERRRMGKTDLMLPVVSLGTGPGQDVNVMKFAIAQGMNFIHNSTGYKNGQSIINVAEAIKGQRDKVILGLKITWEPDDDASMDAALEKLGTDHADICFFNLHKAGQVKEQRFREGAERWKKMGKFKYIGLTSHGETAACLTAALDQGFYDVLMPSYHMGMEEEFLPIFKRAEKEGVGIVLMKTNREISDYHAAVPHYLATPGITTINRGADSFPMIKQLIEASQQKADQQAGMQLRERVKLTMKSHCTMCGSCTETCPQGFDVADVVRCSDYYLERSEYVELALETYRTLSRAPSPSACGNCSLCERTCPNGVPIVHHIRRAESTLA